MPRQRASIASAFRERKLPMEEKKGLLDQDERVVEIELERLRGFVNHLFKVQTDSQIIALQESIKKYGILNPLIVRPRQYGTYEIISGHRRKFATEKIGYSNVPVIIRVLKDDEAVVSMVDSNLQREMISPSEKAFAYKMKYETIKRKAERRKCGQVDHNFGKKSIELIGEECGDSQKQVERYIKITELIPEMLEKVDDGSMAMKNYQEMIRYGVDNDSAGYCAPQGMRNILLIGATLYQWKHMIRQRTCRRNTKETRYVMLKIWKQLLEQNRELFSDCGPFCMNGGCEEGKMTCEKSISPQMLPTDIIRVDFPKLCEASVLEEGVPDEDTAD